MGKYCTSCGTPLIEGAKFCTGCRAAVVKKEDKAYTEKVFSDIAPAYGAAGELALPRELNLFPTAADAESLFSVLRGGFRGLVGGFKRTLGDKKLLALVITLVIIWLMVNILVALGIFPLPVRLLSWLTAAQGSLIGGTLGKGIVAALLAQIIVDKSMFGKVKRGLGQLGGIAKGGKGAFGPVLLGSGIALIVTNLMISSNLQNIMVCIAAFLLSAKALTQNGFLRRLITALLSKTKNATINTLMQGWTLGFALFAAASFIPGGSNGYLLGILLLIVGSVAIITSKNKKEATTE